MEQKLRQIVNSVLPIRDKLRTEQDARQALVLPLIGALGYDIFNPSEVVVGFRTGWMPPGRELDVRVVRDAETVLVVECRMPGAQIYSRSTTTSTCFAHMNAGVAALTNGWKYRLYTDLSKPGSLDTKAFAVLDVQAPEPDVLAFLELLTRERYDRESVRAAARKMAMARRELDQARRAGMRGNQSRIALQLWGEYRPRIDRLRELVREHVGIDLASRRRIVEYAIDTTLMRLREKHGPEQAPESDGSSR